MRFTPAERERIANCSICRRLSDVECADHIWTTDVLPDAAHKLETIATLGIYYPLLQQCPECGTYYTYHRDCGYMEDDESLKRLSDEEARVWLEQEIGDHELSVKVMNGLTPGLREHGFKLVYRTNPWAWLCWRDECVQMVEVRTVDQHWFYADYSQKNSFPRQSLLVRCGAFYEFMPTFRAIQLYFWPDLDHEPVKRRKDGRPRPAPRDFQASLDLDCPSAPRRYSAIWRVEQNGSNLRTVLAEMNQVILSEGLAWLEKMRDFNRALQELDAQIERLRAIDACGHHELFVAYCMADKAGDRDKQDKYCALLDEKWERIQQSLSDFFD